MTVNSTMQTDYTSLGVQNQNSTSSTSGSFSDIMQQLADQLLNTIDTNKNGSIDKTEFSSAAQNLAQKLSTNPVDSTKVDNAFSSIDKNGDGNIDGSELLSALKDLTKQSSQAKGVHHHHHHSQSGASAMSSQNTNTQASIPSSSQNSDTLQSVLMKNILSAYNTSHSQTNGGGISLTA